MTANTSMAADMVRASASLIPTSFNGDGQLFGLNLFLMTAFTCLGLMMAGRQVRVLWRDRVRDSLLHPVSIWRIAWLLAGLAVFLRCGTEAANLWAWSPTDVETTARVIMAKRWIDPIALLLAGCWMLLVTLSNASMEQQLTRRPYPVDMLTRVHKLWRPAVVIALSLIMAVGVAWTR